MKSKFREFYSDVSVDLKKLEDDTLIVFDTNCLLNIYRYSMEISVKFLNAIEQVSEHVWIPYQVGLEFNLNRKNIMEDIKKAPNKFEEEVKKDFINVENQIIDKINKYVIKSVDAKEVKSNMINKFKEELKNLEGNFLDNEFNELANLINSNKDHLNKLVEILEGKIGDSYSQIEIDAIIKEGEERFKLEIPPGYKDEKEKEGKWTCFNGLKFPSKFGDLILWKQIISRVSSETTIKKVVLVTDENKPDWWYFLGPKKIGPRAELKNELIRLADADLIMINSNSFIQQMEDTKEDLVEEPGGFFFFFEDDLNEDEINMNNESSYLIKKIEMIESMLKNDLSFPKLTNQLKEKFEKELVTLNELKTYIKEFSGFISDEQYTKIKDYLKEKEVNYFGMEF